MDVFEVIFITFSECKMLTKIYHSFKEIKAWVKCVAVAPRMKAIKENQVARLWARPRYIRGGMLAKYGISVVLVAYMSS